MEIFKMEHEQLKQDTKTLINIYKLEAQKKLGQNFILDQNITDEIVAKAPMVQDAHILEIGPGPGALTRSILAARPKKLYAIEYDIRTRPIMQLLESHYPDILQVFFADALSFDFSVLPSPIHVIANLPYNIGTALVTKWLTDETQRFASITVMLQKEVSLRLVAKPRTKEYGRLAVLAQTLSDCNIIMELAPHHFHPAPKVHSAVVSMQLKHPTLPFHLRTLEKVTAAGFGMRRKKLRSSLSRLISEHELLSIGIDPNHRAEELTVEEFNKIAQFIEGGMV
jgi:16S rRNA (adenine1518-N6/adenine1519-N6)-dimethyltransferase